MILPTRQLPDVPLALSELSLGCAQLGNMYREVSDADARGTVDAAWELGLRSFDTAPHYGLGLSERRLGAALASRPRSAYVLSSKVGRLLEPRRRSLTGSTIRASSCRPPTGESGTSAGTAFAARSRRAWSAWDSIGWTSSTCTIRTITGPMCSPPGYAALEELRTAGIVGAIGAGMNQSKMLADLVRDTDVDVVMLAGRYTLLEQDALDDLLPLCCERRVAIVAAGVFNSGLLARAHPAGDARYDYGDAPSDLVERAQAIAGICGRHGTTLPAAALAFPLAHPAVASVCIGARSATQVQRNAALYGEAIAPDLWSELKAEGLLRDDAPVPR